MHLTLGTNSLAKFRYCSMTFSTVSSEFQAQLLLHCRRHGAKSGRSHPIISKCFRICDEHLSHNTAFAIHFAPGGNSALLAGWAPHRASCFGRPSLFLSDKSCNAVVALFTPSSPSGTPLLLLLLFSSPLPACRHLT